MASSNRSTAIQQALPSRSAEPPGERLRATNPAWIASGMLEPVGPLRTPGREEATERRVGHAASPRCRRDARDWCRSSTAIVANNASTRALRSGRPAQSARCKAGSVTSKSVGKPSAASSPALRSPWRRAARWPCELGSATRERSGALASASAPGIEQNRAQARAHRRSRPAQADGRSGTEQAEAKHRPPVAC